jgi:hypothetical protein
MYDIYIYLYIYIYIYIYMYVCMYLVTYMDTLHNASEVNHTAIPIIIEGHETAFNGF